MTIEEIQQEVIEEFEGFDDWMDKYQMLIDQERASGCGCPKLTVRLP